MDQFQAEWLKASIDAAVLTVVSAIFAAVIDQVRKRRRRRTLLRAIVLELLSAAAYIDRVPGVVSSIANRVKKGGKPRVRKWTTGDWSDAAFAAAWSNEDSRIVDDDDLALAVMNAYGAVRMYRNAEAEIVRLRDNGDGETAYEVAEALAKAAPESLEVVEFALGRLRVTGIRFPKVPDNLPGVSALGQIPPNGAPTERGGRVPEPKASPRVAKES